VTFTRCYQNSKLRKIYGEFNGYVTTSYGVSTIYFAAALRDLGGGLVVGSELESSKVMNANQHLAEAGLSIFAEIRAGDGMEYAAKLEIDA
jgi:predicted O-methyltransferase YrrM